MNSTYKQIKSGSKGYLLFTLVILVLISSGCKKFLDQKPKLALIVPQTPQDLERLLLNGSGMNRASASGYAEYLSDNIFMFDADLNLYNNGNNIQYGLQVQNFIWSSTATGLDFWTLPYTYPIYYSNVVLDQLPLIHSGPKDSNLVKALRGSALFIRAFHFYALAQVYGRPYDAQYFSYPGIVLRQTSDASIIEHKRATVKETYDKIIADLKEAASLLPISTVIPTRPCQAAAYAALARVYLSMRDYTNAALYANLALAQRSVLLDYNTRIPVGANPFDPFHVEVIYDDIASSVVLLEDGGRIDTLLYNSYDANDLRKALFFKASVNGSYRWQGTYNSTGNSGLRNIFDGFATDELYLIRAECSARAGNKDAALVDLNALLIKRWKNSVTYPYVTATDATDALGKILTERRKELVFRGQRWTDIRRFNLEGANITLKRIWNGTAYTLPPSDKRTVIPIPQLEIDRSGIEQNPR